MATADLQPLLDTIRILHIDTDLVAVDKPAGLLVHPSLLAPCGLEWAPLLAQA